MESLRSLKRRNVGPERRTLRERVTSLEGKTPGCNRLSPLPSLSTICFHLVGRKERRNRGGTSWRGEVNAPSSRRRRIRLLADDARGTRTTLSKARRDARANARELRGEIPRRIGVWGWTKLRTTMGKICLRWPRVSGNGLICLKNFLDRWKVAWELGVVIWIICFCDIQVVEGIWID